jgi:hypothetical protein
MRVEGSGGDDGVEAFADIPRYGIVGIQAKYFDSLTTGRWQQIDKSVNQALKKHRRLRQYIITVPIDRTPSQVKKWRSRVTRWKLVARRLHLKNVRFIFWGASEIDDLLTRTQHHGRLRYWFGDPEFSREWLWEKFDAVVRDLDQRYTPAHHIPTESELALEAFGHTSRFIRDYYDVAGTLAKEWTRLEGSIQRRLLPEKLGRLAKTLASEWNKLRSRIGDGRRMPEVGEISGRCTQLSNAIHPFVDEVRELHKKTPKKPEAVDQPFEYLLHRGYEFRSALDDFQRFAERFVCASLANLLIIGEAGTGKSHLMANALAVARSEGRIGVLVLGEYFRSTADPWEQVLSVLGWEHGFEAFFSSLDALAETTGFPALVCIDALNESTDRSLWRTGLGATATKLKPFKHVRLVVSCRSDFVGLTVPTPISEGRAPEWGMLCHHGFGRQRFKAVAEYFKGYRVQTDHFPPLIDEFDNPLFLRTVCEAYEDDRLPAGPIALQTVMQRLIEKIIVRLERDIDCPKHITKQAIQLLVDTMMEQKSHSVMLREVRPGIDALLPGRGETQSLYRHLRSNGLIAEVGARREEEIRVRFEFERFSDYFLAERLLDRYAALGLDNAFKEDGGALWKYVSDLRYFLSERGVVAALAVLVPERFRTELPKYSAGGDLTRVLLECFLESLPWRTRESFSPETLRFLNVSFNMNPTRVLERLLTLATIPNHPFNAHFLHKNLLGWDLPKRDKIWSIYINDYFPPSNSTVIERILEWAELTVPNSISPDQTELAAIVFCWFCSSSAQSLRDTATRRAIRLLQGKTDTATKLISYFEKVNDPYVAERVYAVAAGVAMREFRSDKLAALARVVFDQVFAKKGTPHHLLLRDYAQAVLEIARHRDAVPKGISANAFRPPYRSKWPKRVWSEKKVNSFERKKCYSRIMWSIRPEHMGMYGDFGRYVMGSMLHNFQKYRLGENRPACYANLKFYETEFDDRFGRRWVLQRLHELGWTPARFGKYEDRLGYEVDRSRPRVERISKKYQWIALYELLGLLSDHYQMAEDWGDKPRVFHGAWQITRDFDPSLLPEDAVVQDRWHADPPCWWNRYPNPIPDLETSREVRQWLFSKDVSVPRVLIEVADPTDANKRWLALGGMYHWEEAAPFDEDFYASPRKRMWIHLRALLVQAKDRKPLCTHLQRLHFWGHGIRVTELDGWLGEYPWGGSHGFIRAWCAADDDWLGKPPVAAVQTVCSCNTHLEGVGSRFVPSPQVLDLLGAHWTGNRLDFDPDSGAVVCFNPSLSAKGSDVCLVQEAAIRRALEKNGLALVWVVLGERGTIGGDNYAHIGQGEFSGVYSLTKKGLVGCITQRVRKIYAASR